MGSIALEVDRLTNKPLYRCHFNLRHSYSAGLAQLGERQTEVHFIRKSEGRVFDPHKPHSIFTFSPFAYSVVSKHEGFVFCFCLKGTVASFFLWRLFYIQRLCFEVKLAE